MGKTLENFWKIYYLGAKIKLCKIKIKDHHSDLDLKKDQDQLNDLGDQDQRS